MAWILILIKSYAVSCASSLVEEYIALLVQIKTFTKDPIHNLFWSILSGLCYIVHDIKVHSEGNMMTFGRAVKRSSSDQRIGGSILNSCSQRIEESLGKMLNSKLLLKA